MLVEPANPEGRHQASATGPRDAPPNPEANHRSRMRTNTAEIDDTISHPGSVKINVKGAFIVDQGSTSPKGTSPSMRASDTKDIRLPNHTAVVSHIAADVSYSPRSRSKLQTASKYCSDWRVPGKTSILLKRTRISGTRGPS